MSISPLQRRLRRIVARGAKRALARVEPPPPPPPRRLGLRWPQPLPTRLGVERATVTRRLLERVPPEALAAAEAAIGADPELQSTYAGAHGAHRLRVQLALGVHLGVEPLIASSGLPTAQPPEDVHAMARGPLAAAGGLYEADLIADALAGVGVAIGRLRAALDFGCSSGRVLRVLAAAYPEIAWYGCDPNEGAIAWARAHLPAGRFLRSPQRPPLELPDASLDLVYAISIWSHFNPAIGLLWLDEMRRVLRPGGHLVMTTHGTTTIVHDVGNGLRDPEQGEEIRLAISESGAWYHEEFGEEGDWGVVDPDWGTAFLSAEWLLAHACPAWQVLDFAPGRNLGNQDVWVLRRT